MIVVHEYPFMMVEHKLFRIHNKLLNPKYEHFGRLAIRDRAMKLYVEEKEKMKVILAHAGKISLTSDLWTSNQTKGYMCITGHFLDADWKLQNRILNFCLLPPPHSGVAIADKMYACLSEWGIDKISTITFDNAPTNDAAIRSLKEQFQQRDTLYFGGKIFHVRCCAHILNLLVQDGLAPLKISTITFDIAQVSIGGTTENVDTDTQRKEFESWFRIDYDVTMTTRKELDIYLDEYVLLGGGKDFDVLCLWKSMTLKYLILSKMARDVLSIPVTIVPSELDFSAGRRIIGDDRCSLGDDTLEGLLCASNWF